MADKPSYAPCEVTLEIGDGEHLCRLPLKQIAELQEKCDAPIGTIYARVATGGYKAEDLVETVRLGLVGGGMTGLDARKLMDRYLDHWPLEVWHRHALAILMACIHGYEGQESTEEEKKSAAPSNGSTSPEPTATASPPDTRSRQSSA